MRGKEKLTSETDPMRAPWLVQREDKLSIDTEESEAQRERAKRIIRKRWRWVIVWLPIQGFVTVMLDR